MKRCRDTQNEMESTKKHVTHKTFVKWKCDLDHECQTMTWLDCKIGMERGKKIVEKSKCKVCTEFVNKIQGRKHFSNKCIRGANSIHMNNIHDYSHNN